MINLTDQGIRNKVLGNQIAIGYFDGVHKGHQKILRQLGENDLIITFVNHLTQEEIYPPQIKLFLLKQYCPNVIILDLNVIATESKESFIQYLKQYEPSVILTGEDFHFGHNQSGDINDLKTHFNVKISKYAKRDCVKISSTTIRKFLQDGLVRKANELLTRQFSINDLVIKGDGMGGKIGIPTINFCGAHPLLKHGVYETRVVIKDKEYRAVTNIGIKPTFGTHSVTTETHILDYDGPDLYGEILEVKFIKYLREEKKFPNVNQLVTQINRDIKQVRVKKK